MVGQTVSRYRMVGKPRGGGMGVVTNTVSSPRYFRVGGYLRF
jgi:hypothetical protein